MLIYRKKGDEFMKSSKLIEMYKDGNIIIPIYIFKNYKKLNIELNEFIFLMYLCTKGNKIVFDPATFSQELNLSLEEVMEMVSNLSDKNLLKVEVIKSEKKIMEEMIELDDFYNKLSLIVMDDINTPSESDKSNIFEIIEKEFGRTLSPIEFEIIQAWIEGGLSEELIQEALKEATFNGVSNLRYIDKILYEWGKDGVKTKEDVEKRKKQRNRKVQKEEETKDIDLDIMEWDWFDEEE